LFKVIEGGAVPRPYKTSYWSAIVSIALYCTIFELFDVEKYRENREKPDHAGFNTVGSVRYFDRFHVEEDWFVFVVFRLW